MAGALEWRENNQDRDPENLRKSLVRSRLQAECQEKLPRSDSLDSMLGDSLLGNIRNKTLISNYCIIIAIFLNFLLQLLQFYNNDCIIIAIFLIYYCNYCSFITMIALLLQFFEFIIADLLQ